MEAQAAKPRNGGKKNLMGNKFLESLTRTHISVPITMYVVLAGSMIYYALSHEIISAVVTVAAFFSGLLAFTLLEYLTHKYVFHMNTDTSLRADIQYKFHGVHHEYPKDKGRLAMPPVVSIVFTAGFFFLFKLMMGDLAYGFLPGFVVGYAGYLFVHYIVHAFRPPNNVFKILWVNHGIHHYKSPDKAFGVSSPLWDYIFRTMP